jgi:uncharacterized YigZ family protein
VLFTVTARRRYEPASTKGSRFIATVVPITNEDEAKVALAGVANELPDASHHCWAWRIARPVIDRAGDDGEPGGSAGRPILAQLTGRDLVDTAVIVSRYWGGTKLGVGGLVRAYGGAAGEALDRAGRIEWKTRVGAVVVHDHPDTDHVIRTMSTIGAQDVDVAYGVRVTRYIEVGVDDLDALAVALANATGGRASVE